MIDLTPEDKLKMNILFARNEINLFKKELLDLRDEIKNLDLALHLAEVRHIHGALSQIVDRLDKLEKDKKVAKVQMELLVDGYEMVRKPRNFDELDASQPAESQSDLLDKVFEGLNEKWKFIVTHRIGLYGEKEKKWVDVGRAVGLTGARSSQIFNKAIRNIRFRITKGIIPKELVKRIKHEDFRRVVGI